MNNSRQPFNDPDVRRAVRQAIDKEAYRELNNGFGTIIGGPVPPSDPWYEDLTDVAPYDPDAARALLEGAGVRRRARRHAEVAQLLPAKRRVRRLAARRGRGQRHHRDGRVRGVAGGGVHERRLRHDRRAPRRAARHRQLRQPRVLLALRQPRGAGAYRQAKTSTDQEAATELFRQTARQISEDSPVDWLGLATDITVSTTRRHRLPDRERRVPLRRFGDHTGRMTLTAFPGHGRSSRGSPATSAVTAFPGHGGPSLRSPA